ELGRGVVVGPGNWEQQLESNKQALALEFVQRSRFISAYPTSMSPNQFVDAMNLKAGNVLTPIEWTSVFQLFRGSADTANTMARAQALRQISEDQDLSDAEFHRAFVLMQFFGYLRRDPNSGQ